MFSWKILPFGAICVFLILFSIVRVVKRRNRKKEIQRNAEDKLREEALDKILTEGRKPEDGKLVANMPFDVKYDVDQRKKNRSTETDRPAEIMLQLTERCELSTRKYMFHIEDRITIGSQAGENDVVAVSPRIAKRQCELFRIDQRLFVKKISEGGNVLLVRGKRQHPVGQDGVQLQSHDELRIGDYVYEVTFL